MNKDVYAIAAEINKLHKEAFILYEPIVKDMCGRKATGTEGSRLLDYLLGFAVIIQSATIPEPSRSNYLKFPIRRNYKKLLECLKEELNSRPLSQMS